MFDKNDTYWAVFFITTYQNTIQNHRNYPNFFYPDIKF